MPPTEPCILGAENKTNIEAVMRELQDFKTEVRSDIKDIAACVTKLTNHYSQRLTWSTVLIITSLSSALVGTVMWIITH